jgi:hypothetical protein
MADMVGESNLCERCECRHDIHDDEQDKDCHTGEYEKVFERPESKTYVQGVQDLIPIDDVGVHRHAQERENRSHSKEFHEGRKEHQS